MLTEATTTGIGVMGDMPWGTHFCYFFETKRDLLDTSVPFFRAGLENHEFCLWSIYSPVTEADALEALRQSIPDLGRHLADGGIEIVLHPAPSVDGTIAETRSIVRRLQEKLDDALARGYTGMRVAGCPACLQQANTEYFREFERELGNAVANRRMIALCYFPLAESSAAAILDAARSHQFALARRQGDWEIIEAPEIGFAKAEITKLNAQLEQRVAERTRELAAANEELRRQKEILETIFGHLPVMINFVDQNHRLKLVNREWERTLGWSLEEIQSQNIDIVVENYPDPEYREQVREFVLNSKGEWADFKTTVRDGRVIDTSWAMLHLSDGTGIGIGQDITKRKLAEQELRRQKEVLQIIFDHIPVMIAFVGQNRQLELVNRAWERTLEWSLEDIRSQKIDIAAELYPDPRDRQRVFDWMDSNAEWADFKTTVKDGRIIDTTWALIRLSDGAMISIGQDISERKRAEQELRKQKELLQTIFDHIPVMVGFVDQKGRPQVVNQEWERTLGWSLEEIRRQNIDVIEENYPDPEYREKVRDFVENSDAEWADFKTTVRDGRVIDTSWAMLRLSDGTGIGIGQDITKRKRAEEALRESEERFRQLAENIHDLFWIKTPDFKRVLYLSPAYESISGRSPEDRYRDLDYQPFLNIIHPEDRERMAEIIRRGAGAEFDIEFRITRPDGAVRWIRDRGFPIRDRSGQVYRIAGIANDITERKLAEEALRESEERFRQLTENIREVFWLRSPDFKTLLYVSPMYEKVCGQTCESLYAAGPDLVGVHPEDRTRVIETVQNLTGREFEIEYRIITKEGEVRWVRDRGFPIRDQSGQIYRIGGVAEDITDRKEAEDRLKASSEQLRALSASLQSAREQEAMRISHQVHDELGGLLTGLRWELEALEKMTQQPANEAQLQTMRDKLSAMLGLTDTTINVVRRIASELRPSILDDLGLMEAIEWQTQQFQARTGIQCRCESALQTIPLGDQESTAVFRIVQEALTNVLRHAQATRVNVTMTQEDGMFVLTVTDNGRGITPAEELGRESLGLLGMRERAHLIGGMVDIVGFQGIGTTLHVRVPLGGGVV
jgi:PAS domain S-box-containing protein